MTAASVRGVQPAFSAAVTAAASLARWAAVSRQSGPSAVKNSPIGPPPRPSRAGPSSTRTGAADGSMHGSLDGSDATPAPRDCTGCTPSGTPVAARSRLGLQLLRPVGPVIHSLAAGGNGVRRLHPVRPVAAQRRELVLKGGDGGVVQDVADQAQVQVPALRAAIGWLDPGRDDVRVAPRDDALGLQPVQAGAYRPLRQPGVADQRGHRGECTGAVRPGVVGQADEHELARGGRLPTSVGRDRGQVQRPGDRLDARRASLLRRASPQRAAWPLVSVCVSFTPVRDRSPVFTRIVFAQFAEGGGRR
jgi:hypothetical protein